MKVSKTSTMHRWARPEFSRLGRRSGTTLVELVIVLAIVAVITLLAAPSLGRWQRDQRLKGFARSVADVLHLARAEATRTGNRHVVFFGPTGTTDPSGTPLTTASGDPAAVLALVDGPPATSNCRINGGEDRRSLQLPRDVTWGVSLATARAPGDLGGAPFAPPQSSGGTFADPANNPAPWVLFRPDGVPVVFTATPSGCGTIGQTGTGGAGFYVTHGGRDYAIVLTPVGGVRVLVWNEAGGQWQS